MITNPEGPGARRGEEPERSSSPSRASRDDVDASPSAGKQRGRAAPREEKDQGFGPSHGYPRGHGGPTSPGDAPAKRDASDAHDPDSREDVPDDEPDRR